VTQDLWRSTEQDNKPLSAEKVWDPSLNIYVWRLLSGGSAPGALRLDDTGTGVSYIGEAPIGTAASAASWRIKKLTEASDGDVTLEWADGNSDFDNVWNDRASLSYS
jgi:hypothetical protein